MHAKTRLHDPTNDAFNGKHYDDKGRGHNLQILSFAGKSSSTLSGFRPQMSHTSLPVSPNTGCPTCLATGPGRGPVTHHSQHERQVLTPDF